MVHERVDSNGRVRKTGCTTSSRTWTTGSTEKSSTNEADGGDGEEFEGGERRSEGTQRSETPGGGDGVGGYYSNTLSNTDCRLGETVEDLLRTLEEDHFWRG